MNEILRIIEEYQGHAGIRVYFAYDHYVAHLDVTDGFEWSFVGYGDTPRQAVNSLIADIRAVKPNLLAKSKQEDGR